MISPGTWPYINEIVEEDLLFVAYFGHWFWISIAVLLFPVLINNFGAPFTFAVFALISLGNIVFASFLLKETYGLDKQQMKTLYQVNKKKLDPNNFTTYPFSHIFANKKYYSLN